MKNCRATKHVCQNDQMGFILKNQAKALEVQEEQNSNEYWFFKYALTRL